MVCLTVSPYYRSYRYLGTSECSASASHSFVSLSQSHQHESKVFQWVQETQEIFTVVFLLPSLPCPCELLPITASLDVVAMLEMRNRMKQGSSGSYTRVSTEDDELDVVPTLNLHRRPKVVPRQKSVACTSRSSRGLRTRAWSSPRCMCTPSLFPLTLPICPPFLESSPYEHRSTAVFRLLSFGRPFPVHHCILARAEFFVHQSEQRTL